MLDPPVENVGRLDPLADGFYTAFDLGDHAALDDAFPHQMRNFGYAHLLNQGAFVVQIPHEATYVRQHNELFRTQRSGNFRSSSVGIDIVALGAVHAVGHRGHHGDHIVGDGVQDGLRLDGGNLAHIAVVIAVLRQLFRLNQAAVQAAQAAGLTAMGLKHGHQILVDPAAEHHLDDVHGLGVGVAQAVDESGLLTYLFQHIGNLRTAAMDHHHIDAHQLQQYNIGDHRLPQFFGDHGVAAVLDYNGLLVKFLNIGQGLIENLCPLHMGKRHGNTPLRAYAARCGAAAAPCGGVSFCSPR